MNKQLQLKEMSFTLMILEIVLQIFRKILLKILQKDEIILFDFQINELKTLKNIMLILKTLIALH